MSERGRGETQGGQKFCPRQQEILPPLKLKTNKFSQILENKISIR
jgi:hypothetical protein